MSMRSDYELTVSVKGDDVIALPEKLTRKETMLATRMATFAELEKLPSPPPNLDKPGNYRGLKVYNRSGTQHARATGAERPCNLEGCSGNKLTVIWPDGTLTHLCGKGLKPFKDGWKIIGD